MAKMRVKRYVVVTALLAIAALGLWCTRQAWEGAVVEWLVELEVAHTGAWLPEVDQADVYLLGNLMEERGQGGSLPADFMGYPVKAKATLNETEARSVAQQWRAIPRGYQYIHLCHEPLYGLRFRRGDKIFLETTVCWSCETYDFRAFSGDSGMMEWGFDAHSTSAQVLLGLLMKTVPPPAQEQEFIRKEFPESSSARGQ